MGESCARAVEWREKKWLHPTRGVDTHSCSHAQHTEREDKKVFFFSRFDFELCFMFLPWHGWHRKQTEWARDDNKEHEGNVGDEEEKYDKCSVGLCNGKQRQQPANDSLTAQTVTDTIFWIHSHASQFANNKRTPVKQTEKKKRQNKK